MKTNKIKYSAKGQRRYTEQKKHGGVMEIKQRKRFLGKSKVITSEGERDTNLQGIDSCAQSFTRRPSLVLDWRLQEYELDLKFRPRTFSGEKLPDPYSEICAVSFTEIAVPP